MGSAAIPVVLVFLLVFLSWRVVYSFNKDLVRARAWEDLIRRSLPFAALTLMALSVFLIQGREEQWVLFTWAAVSAVLVISANLLSIPMAERRASRAFRRGDYPEAAEQYQMLVEERPLARYFAFLGAALGASGRDEEAIDASTRAIERDPEYGLAYYNRALILRRQNHRGRAKKDLQRALESDLPRRFKTSARNLLEGMAG